MWKWKKGDLVWANLKYPDSWIPGRVQDPSESFGVLVSFFGLKEPRYFPALHLRRFDRHFGTLISGSWWLHLQLVNRALRAHFWSVSYGLWCPCQPPISSPDLDKGNSILWCSLSSDLALAFVRDIAISRSVPLEGLAEANRSTAQILSFRRYVVDYEQSKALYDEIRVSAERMGHSEEPGSYFDSSKEEDCPAVDPMFPETPGLDMGHDIDLSVRDPSPHEQLLEGENIEIGSWNLRKPLAVPESIIFVKACETPLALLGKEENDDHPSKNVVAATAYRNKTTNKGNVESVKTLALLGKEENDDHPSKSGEHVHDIVAATAHRNKTRNQDNVKFVKMKRQMSLKAASADCVKKQKIAAHQTASADKPSYECRLKAFRITDPRCLQMKFLGNGDNLPSEANLVKRFSMFGKIDTSRTYVDASKRTAEVVFLKSIDAIMAYKYARSKKVSFGQSEVVYRFDLFKQSSECNNKVNLGEEEPTLKSCLKKCGSADEKGRRRNLKVKFDLGDH